MPYNSPIFIHLFIFPQPTIFAVVVHDQVAHLLRTDFTKWLHNFSDVAEVTAVTLSWETDEGRKELLITHAVD